MTQRVVAAWLDPWICLRAVIARDRANAVGVPWVTSRETRARRLALLRGMPEPEERSWPCCSWPFDVEEGQGEFGDRTEYMRAYRKKGSAKPASVELWLPASVGDARGPPGSRLAPGARGARRHP